MTLHDPYFELINVQNEFRETQKCRVKKHLFCIVYRLELGLLVDSEIVLSTRYVKTMVFINKNPAYQQGPLIQDLT